MSSYPNNIGRIICNLSISHVTLGCCGDGLYFQINDSMQEYIEILISAEDYAAVLAVYSKLKINETKPSFDDGYICGEIVRWLMKLERYGDKMLVKYASLWAKIFGFGMSSWFIHPIYTSPRVTLITIHSVRTALLGCLASRYE